MKHLKSLKSLIALALMAVVAASCHKDKVAPVMSTPTANRSGVYILNQGNFGTNNSSLTYYDYTAKTLTADIYSSVNGGAKLGNTANDAEIYGSKMYIVVNVSSVIDIVNAKTGKLIKQDSLVNNHVAREPRSIAFYKSNAFITSYDGTVAVMDTTTLTISQYIKVGANPEQLVVSNGKLYVANGGGQNYPNVANTVSVIDLTSLTVTKTLTVGSDPYAVSADSYGNVYVAAYGVYPTSSPTLSIINSSTDVVTSTTAYSGGAFSMIGDNAYYLSSGKIFIYNVKTGVSTTTNFITDGTTFTAAYAIAADPSTGEVFVTDAKDYASNGTVTAFDNTGKKEYSLITGINPGTITFVNK
jgi:YVTN family beta-propeller protein